MHFIIQVLLIILLIFISYQDYKYRAVSWIAFPLLLISFFVFNILYNPIIDIINNSIVNLTFIFFLFVLITAYFSVKHKRLVNLSNGFIGWGDILFILCMGFLFSPLNFIVFYLLSLIFIIVSVLVAGWILKKRVQQIPLAGMQAFMLLLLFIVNLCFPFFKFYTDEWLVNKLM